MKRFLMIAFFVAIGFSIQDAKAQNATGNASDNGTALTTPPPQLTPGVGVNAINAPAITVPTAPPVQVLPAPAVTIAPGLPVGGILPAVPSVPVPPPMPNFTAPPGLSNFTTTLNLPALPKLPPVPPISARPNVRMPRG